MNGFRLNAPVDPHCPEVIEFNDGFADDPITEMSGCADEIATDFERRHRKTCRRCQEHGAANIEVVE